MKNKNNDVDEFTDKIIKQYDKKQKLRPFTADWSRPTAFMTYESFMERLGKDLNQEEPMVIFDCPIPNNEEEYQEKLNMIQMFSK